MSVSETFTHFLLWVSKRKHSRNLSIERFWQGEIIYFIGRIKSLGNASGKLQMLILIITYRHMIRFINQNIGRLENGIKKERSEERRVGKERRHRRGGRHG